MNALELSRWLWDFYLLSTLLLLAVVVAGIFIKQPARRNALAWAAAFSLLALACLTAMPNWSQWHLSSPAPPAPAWAADLQPVIGQAIQQTPVYPAAPSEGLPPDAFPAATQFRMIDVGVIKLYVFVSGSAIVVAWLTLGLWQVRRLRVGAEATPALVRKTLESLAAKKDEQIHLGMRRDLPVAVAVGLSRPWILLPHSLVAHANHEQLRSVLAHELAHIEHRDLWLLALLRGLMVLLWPHPLFWFFRRRVRLDQEILADAAAAELTSRGEYAEQLVALARNAMQVRVPRLASSVGLWEKPSQLMHRVKLLLDEKLTILQSCSRKWRVGTFVALVGVALGLSLVTLTPAEVEEQVSVKKSDRDDRLRATDLRDFGRLNPNLLTSQGTNIKSGSAIDFDTSKTIVPRRDDLLRVTDPRDYRLKPELLRPLGTVETNLSSTTKFNSNSEPSVGFDLSTPFVQRGTSVRLEESPSEPLVANEVGRPPKLLYLAWQPGNPESNEWDDITLWNLEGETLGPTEAKAFLERAGMPLFHQVQEKSLHPLLLFFQVDNLINAPINPMAITSEGKLISVYSARSKPSEGLNVAVLTTPSWQVTAWPETVSLKLKYATENYAVLKKFDTVDDQPIEIAEGVRWYLDPTKARDYDPQTGRLTAAPGKTAGVLEIRNDIHDGLTSYAVRIFAKKRARQPTTAYTTVNTLNGKNYIVEVSDAIDSADQIERVIFLSQQHSVEEIKNVPLRLDLLPKGDGQPALSPNKSDAYENGVFVPEPSGYVPR